MGDLNPISKVMVAIFVKWCLHNNLKTKRHMDTIFAAEMHHMKGQDEFKDGWPWPNFQGHGGHLYQMTFAQ